MAHVYDLTTAAQLLQVEEKEVKRGVRHGDIHTIPGTGRDIFISENEITRYGDRKSASWSIAEIGQLEKPARLVHQSIYQRETFSDDSTPILLRLYELSDETNCAGLIVIGDLRRDVGWHKNDYPPSDARHILESIKNAHGSPTDMTALEWQDNMSRYSIFDFCWVGLFPNEEGNAVAIEYAFTHSDIDIRLSHFVEIERYDGTRARDYVQIHELDNILGDGVLTTWPLMSEDSELENNQFINAINDVEREIWHVDPHNLYLAKRSIERIADYPADITEQADIRDRFLNLAYRATFDLMAQRECSREVPDSAIWRVPESINTTLWSPFDGQAPLSERLDRLVSMYPHSEREWTSHDINEVLAFARHILDNVDEYSDKPNEKIAHALRHVLDVIAAWYCQRYENETIAPWWNAAHRACVERRSAIVPEIRAWIDEGLPVKEPAPGDNSQRARNWRILNNARHKIANASLILDNEQGRLFFTDDRENTVWINV